MRIVLDNFEAHHEVVLATDIEWFIEQRKIFAVTQVA